MLKLYSGVKGERRIRGNGFGVGGDVGSQSRLGFMISGFPGELSPGDRSLGAEKAY